VTGGPPAGTLGGGEITLGRDAAAGSIVAVWIARVPSQRREDGTA